MPSPLTKKKVSLDQIYSERQFSVRNTDKGEALTKVYKGPASWDEETRSARFIMTAQIEDRYGDIVVAAGAKLDDFNNNPVALWSHNSRNYPIGSWANIKVIGGRPKRMEGDCVLAPEGTTTQSDEVAKLIAAGLVRACSIGFIPLEWEPIDKENPWGGYQFNEWELLECSPCSIPANPAALVKAAGGDTGLALQAIELVLDEWARTPDGLIVPRKRFETAYAITRNKDVTIHEVRAVDEEESSDSEIAIDDKTIKSIAERVTETLASVFGLTPKQKETTEPELTPKVVVEINTAAAEDAARAVAEEAERVRLAAEAAKAERLAGEQADLELRARAMQMLSVGK